MLVSQFRTTTVALLLNLLLFSLLCSASAIRRSSRIRHPRSRSHFTRQTVSVTEFGAQGDGCTNDTQAFMETWKSACSSISGLDLHVPAGKVFLVGPLNLAGPCKSTVTFLISGTIIAPSDPDAWDGLDAHKWLYFHGIKDLTISGGGTINGMGQEWWARSCKRNATNPCRHAPTAVTFHRIRRLTVHDLTLVNSQQMHMTFSRSSGVTAFHLIVASPADSPNTDGIHISGSNYVAIRDSVISTGDDCISIVGNSSNVRIRNIDCGPGHGISIGSLGKSNLLDQVQDIDVDGALIADTQNGVRIKTWQGGHGFARKMIFRNIIMKNVSNPIIIDQYYCDSNRPCQNQSSAVKVDEISFIGIKGTSATKDVVKFACSDTFPCENIFLKDIQLLLDSGEEPMAYCWKAYGLSVGDVYPPSCLQINGLIEQNIVSSTASHSIAK